MLDRRAGNEQMQLDISEIKTSLKFINKILNGNGEKGLVARVLDHTDRLNKYDERITENKKFLFFLRNCLIGSVISLLVGIVALKFGVQLPHPP